MKMSKLKNWLLLLVVSVTMVGCTNKQVKEETTVETSTTEATTVASTTLESKTGEIEVVIEVLAEDKVVVEPKTLQVKEGVTLMEVMKENYQLEEKDGFITGIEGTNQDAPKNLWWVFTVNDEMSQVGAAELKLAANDKVVWSLTKFE